VKRIHRILLAWLLLLALPFQGLASAAMLPCVAGVPMPVHATAAVAAMAMDGGARDHGAMQAATAAQARDGHCDAAPDVGHHGGDCGASHDGHHGGKAGGVKAKSCAASCAACCVGAAMAPAMPAVLALTPSHFISIPFRAGHVPSVDLALPERPPRTTLA
jgi:hypothetical protein